MPIYLLIESIIFAIPMYLALRKPGVWKGQRTAIAAAIGIPGIFFIVLDMIFINAKIWGFTPDYLLGAYLINLPIEELFYFIAVPLAFLFLYELMRRQIFHKKWCVPVDEGMLGIGVLGCILLASSPDRPYSGVVGLGTVILTVFHVYVLKSRYNLVFILTFALIMVPFFMFNDMLTHGISTISSHPIVWYADWGKSAMYIHSIPLENLFYIFILLLSNVTMYENYRK